MLDDAALDRLVAAGVEGLRISIDGAADTHNRTRRSRIAPDTGCFFRVAEATKAAALRMPVHVITQINQDNLHQLELLGRELKSFGVAAWRLQLAIPSNHMQQMRRPYVIAPEQLRQVADFIERSRQNDDAPPIEVTDTIGYCSRQELALRGTEMPMMWLGCNAGVHHVSIGHSGRVNGCSALPIEFEAGSLHEESLMDIWRDGTRFGYVTEFDTARLSGGCSPCALGRLCRAGCRALAYATTGSIYENRHCLRLLEAQTLSNEAKA